MRESEIRLGEWRLWEQVGLRGAGFPADGVTRLAPDGLAEAADAFGPRAAPSSPGRALNAESRARYTPV